LLSRVFTLATLRQTKNVYVVIVIFLIKRETVPLPNTPMINYEFSDILRSSCVSVGLI